MNLLVIRPGAIGDALLTFPVLKTLRAQSTDPHVIFVSNAAVLPLAQVFGLAEEVSDYAQLQWSELFSTEGISTPIVSERLQRIDRAICWLRDPDGIVERNLRMAGIKQVIVSPGRPPVDRAGASPASTVEGRGDPGGRPALTGPLHITKYLGQTIGLQGGVDMHTEFKLPDSKMAGRPPRSMVGARAVVGGGVGPCGCPAGNDGPIAIHPGSGGAHKCWPARSFAAVIEQLQARNHAVLLLTGPADQERMREILSYVELPPESLLVNEPLLNVAYQLQRCRCYLGNDSGITHLAALLGLPTIALFGPSDPTLWQPVGPRVKVIREPDLGRLSIDRVMNALNLFCTAQRGC